MNRELPSSEAQFQALKAKGLVSYYKCTMCSGEFSGLNIKSNRGWQETQITGYCENCFDKIFEDFEDV